MKTEQKSRLFKMAHAIKDRFNSFADALRYAWRVMRLYLKLKTNTVSFRFKKVDGSIRESNGTLQASIIPEVKGNGKTNFGTLTYFDLDANGWRSAKAENLIF